MPGPSAQNIVPTAAFVNPSTGVLTRAANNFLNSLVRKSNTADSGEVQTNPGSGLEGGGFVADGIDLSIAPNGVSNAMIRESAGTSIIGRYQNSTGDVADVRAVQNRVVLGRQSDQLAFFPSVDVPSVVCDAFRINQAPVAQVVVCTHTVVFNVNGTDYEFPCIPA